MGRWSTGAVTTNQCLKIDISWIIGHIKRGTSYLQGSINWNNGASVGIKLEKQNDIWEIELSYQKTVDREKHLISYKVSLVAIPSNLGTGIIYYFRCPVSFKKCRALYMAYGSDYFKSRASYQHRIYYNCQLSSRLNKHNDSYWRIDHVLEDLYKAPRKTHYKGKQTRVAKRIERLEQKKVHNDNMRWQVLPNAIVKSMRLNGLKDARDMF